MSKSDFLPRLNHVLRTIHWALEVARLASTAAQTGIDTVITLTEGKPEKPEEEKPEEDSDNQ